MLGKADVGQPACVAEAEKPTTSWKLSILSSMSSFRCFTLIHTARDSEMAPKRDLDALESGEFSFTADRIIKKRSKFCNSSSNNDGVDSYLYIVGNPLIHQPSIQNTIPTVSPSSIKTQPKKRSFDDLDDDDEFDSNDIHIVTKRFKLLSSYREKKFVPRNVEKENVETKSNNLWCAQIANELTEYIPTSPGAESDSSSWSTYIDDEISKCTPSPEPGSDDTCLDEDMIDVDLVVSGPYDPTRGIYEAILVPETKEGTLEVMRQRTLEVLQMLNTERAKKYPSLWLRSLCQILHAVVIAAERAPICWQLTATETDDLQKIVAVMEDIAAIMPDWNKPNFPVKLLRNVGVRFWTKLQIPGLLDKVISNFETDA